MIRIEIGDDGTEIDAEAVARAFEVTPDELKRRMREGAITSRSERGAGEDAGRVWLTFRWSERLVRVTADEHGHILDCHAETANESARSKAQDALLDEALAASFPASDPIAISFDIPDRSAPSRGTPDDG